VQESMWLVCGAVACLRYPHAPECGRCVSCSVRIHTLRAGMLYILHASECAAYVGMHFVYPDKCGVRRGRIWNDIGERSLFI
jgi:hypothetical protein